MSHVFSFRNKIQIKSFSSDLEETLVEENVVVTLDDVQSKKIDFNPIIENTMWFA